jgi:hypothetical protein
MLEKMIVLLQYLEAPVHLLEEVVKHQLDDVLPFGFGGLTHFESEKVGDLQLEGILEQGFRLVEGLEEFFEVGAQHKEVERALEFVHAGLELQGRHLGEVVGAQESEQGRHTL